MGWQYIDSSGGDGGPRRSSPPSSTRIIGNREVLRTWPTDSLSTGPRRDGWSFATDLRYPSFTGDLSHHGEDTDLIKTTISRRSEVTFIVELSVLAW